jgi:site-specific DNA recombinase
MPGSRDRLLNQNGHHTRAGGQWATVTIRAMLRNPIHRGEVRLNGAAIEGRHEGITSGEQFAAAQALIRSRATLPPPSHQSQHLLSGIARCGTCGARLRAHYIYQQKADGSRVQRVFYKHGPSVKTGEEACAGLAKSAPQLEAVVLEQIRAAATADRLQQLIVADVQSRQRDRHQAMLRQRDQLLLELGELGDRFTQWADRLDAGRIDEEQFTVQNQRLLERKVELQEQLAALETEVEAEQGLEVTLGEVRKALADFPTIWEALTLEERREMLRLLIEELKVSPKQAELKILFLEPVQLPIDFRQTKRATSPNHAPAGDGAHP